MQPHQQSQPMQITQSSNYNHATSSYFQPQEPIPTISGEIKLSCLDYSDEEIVLSD